VNYVGPALETNYRLGLEGGTWGFRNNRPDYDLLQPGDLIVFGVGDLGGGPPVPPEVGATGTLGEVVVGRLTSPMFVDPTPLWPDEGEDVSYPYRVRFELLERRTQVPLVSGELGPSIIVGLHSAKVGGQGVVTEADGTFIEPLRQALPAGGALVRSAENVWLEIQDKCRQHLATGMPILTLDRQVPNYIVAVEDQRILRRSEQPQSEDGGGPTRAEIARLWDLLVDNGEVEKGHALFFAYALLGRLVEGVGFELNPLRLHFTNRDLAMRQWIPAAPADTGLLDRIGAVRRSPQDYGPAPHKPLLLLLALARLQKGVPRLAPFSDYEPPLRDLLKTFGPAAQESSPELPFWYLQNDGLWEVVTEGGSPAHLPGASLRSPPVAVLRAATTSGGLPTEDFTLLESDEVLFAAAAQLLLESFPDVQDDLIAALELELPKDEDLKYKDYALRRIAEALGEMPVPDAPGSSSFVVSSGRRFHLRTSRRFPRSNGWYSYWFAVRETLWVPGDVFVFQCGLSGTLVVPVSEWASFKDKIPLARAGADDANRQPAVWRNSRKFEFRVAEEPGRVEPEGKLDARQWLDRFDHLRSPPAPDGSVYWWVNQGKSYLSERDGGYLFAPETTRGGAVISMHSNIRRLRPGDTVFHYSQGAVRAVSRVDSAATEGPRPGPEQDGQDERAGYIGHVTYFELAEPIQLSEIPLPQRVGEHGPFMVNGGVKQGYLFPLTAGFGDLMRDHFTSHWPPGSPLAGVEGPGEPRDDVVEPELEEIASTISRIGLRIDGQTLRRYHLSLKTRGFVILTGISGTGKTWLAEAYAEAVYAEYLVVAVAPNWTTNEDLLGYFNPLDNTYHDTTFSQFLREAAAEYANARSSDRRPRRYHLVLDEMNLARVEYYFAKFLSAMETRARQQTATIELAPGEEVLLTPNLIFVGTVNVDETTHGFADKVYDRAQLIELTISRDLLDAFIGDAPWRPALLSVWDALVDVAPFAFRVVDEIRSYVQHAEELGVPWKTALDEQLLQKVMPKVRGVDPRVGDALHELTGICAGDYPLTATKVAQMLDAFNQHGFAAFF